MNRESIKQVVKFSLVGVFNTAVDYGVFYIALAFLNFDKSIAQILATAVAMCGSYIINKYWTFSSRERDASQIFKFIATNIVSMTCTIIFMNLFYDLLGIHEWANYLMAFVGIGFRLKNDIAVMFCKIAASALSLVINFLGNKFWVFRKKSPKS